MSDPTGNEYRPTHDRGEPLPIDLDGIEMRWASQWNESDDGEVRAWRNDIAALIGEVHRLRRVSNGYFEEMVRRTPNSPSAALSTPPEPSPEKPPVKWATIRQDASERGLFAIVDEAMIGRKLSPTRRKLIVGNIVMAVARWRQTFRDCGCWKTVDGYALCEWHEEMLRSQVAPLRAALSTPPPSLDVERLKAWVGRYAVRQGKLPYGATVVDAEELDAYLDRALEGAPDE